MSVEDCFNQAVGIFEDNTSKAVEYRDLSEMSEDNSEYLSDEIDASEERITAIESRFRGSWISTHGTYYVKQTVMYDDNLYVCIQEHTATALLTPDVSYEYWVLRDLQFIRDNYLGKAPLIELPLKNSLAPLTGVGSVTFERNGTATYMDRYGFMQTAIADEPRFEKAGLLLEGGSTNLVLYSGNLYNANWGLSAQLTLLENDTTAPDGTTTATRLTKPDIGGGAANAWAVRGQEVTGDAGEYTASIFVKAGTITKASLGIADESNYNFTRFYVDLTTGAITCELGNLSDCRAEEFGDGWWKLSATATTTASNPQIRVYPDIASAEVAGYIYAWGGQIEALPFSTSYVPTTTVAVTRSDEYVYAHSLGNVPNANKFVVTMDFDTFGYNSYNRIWHTDSTDDSFGLKVGSDMGYAFNNPIGYFADSPAIEFVANTIHSTCFMLSDTMVYGYIDNEFNRTLDGYNEMWEVGEKFYLGRVATDNGQQQLFGHVSNLKIYDEILIPQTVKGI